MKEAVFVLRGLIFRGGRYLCPVCGWGLRDFVGERKLIKRCETGYCPRCNAKARHRRIWRYLVEQTDILTKPVVLVEVAPWWSFARMFARMPSVDYLGIDMKLAGPQVSTLGNALSLPIKSNTCDIVLCIHVLEHVEDDRKAIAELFRILKPGGTAIVSVPIRLDQPTYEDPAITDPEDRLRHFGERSHVRYYGKDFAVRLAEPGFSVSMDAADALDEQAIQRFGLRRDENIFRCTKESPEAA